jgi:hypothetical protein
MLYGYFASAWVHGSGNLTIPAEIAVPLHQLAEWVNRPPMLSYAGQVLGNWRLKDTAVGFTPNNVLMLHTFTNLVDESWFFRVHVAIEGQAGTILAALDAVPSATAAADDSAILAILRKLQSGLVQITKTFHHMPE